MASAKRKTKEELIAGGYCPLCSKAVASADGGFDGCVLYECRRCGTLLLDVTHLSSNFAECADWPMYVDVTKDWEAISDWYYTRSAEIERQTSELQAQLFADIPAMIAPSLPFRGLALVTASRARQKSEEDLRRECEEWRRKRLEARGLPGLTDEGESVLQVLLNWAWRRPDRWVSAACETRPSVCGGAYMSQAELDEHWLPHIEHLISIGRITPKAIDNQDGWIVPSTKEWKSIAATKRHAAPSN